MLFLQQGGSSLANIIFFGGMLVVAYFFMIRPQMKRQKEQVAFADSLEKGKEVVTASGIIGKINKLDDSIVTLEVANGVYIRVTRSAISKELTEAYQGKA